MNKTLLSFLERRKKNAVKASALLQQNDEQSLDEKSDYKSDDIIEENSEHDDEWKVSDDDQTGEFHTSSIGAGLMKIVQKVACGEQDEGENNCEQKVPPQVWQKKPTKVVEVSKPVEPEPTSKVWVPKHKLASQQQNDFTGENDLDLAEAAKLISKTENLTISKKKKAKKKLINTQGTEDEEESFIKIKFNVFQIIKDEYKTFTPSNETINEELVKKKYISRPKPITT